MFYHVLAQTFCMHETFRAHNALELRVEVMSRPMQAKGAMLAEAFPAYITNKRFFTGMNTLVVNEPNLLRETLLPNTALLEFHPGVALFVSSQAR